MEEISKLVLIIGIVFLAAYSMKVQQEAMQTMEAMNNKIQMMFVKG